GYLCLFGVPFIFFDIYFFKSYNFIIFYSISEFYSIFNLTVPFCLLFRMYLSFHSIIYVSFCLLCNGLLGEIFKGQLLK
ncbi:hypothetical protein, partial [Candidatus Bandiella numerosa]|uniref:hypothetical protein n=1 Tax=Candidatus Bandiella numerosa TaxID=2570586 RepID=UPI001F2F2234